MENLPIFKLMRESEQKRKEFNKLCEGKKNLEKSFKLSINIFWILVILSALTYWFTIEKSIFIELPFIKTSLVLSIFSVLLSWILVYPFNKFTEDRFGVYFMHLFLFFILFLFCSPYDKYHMIPGISQDGTWPAYVFLIPLIHLLGNIIVIESIIKNQTSAEHLQIYHTLIGMLSNNNKIPVEYIYYFDHQKFFRIHIYGLDNVILEISKCNSGNYNIRFNEEKYSCENQSLFILREEITEKILRIINDRNMHK